MLEIISQTFWLILPASIANMAPVLFKWLPLLNRPVDGGRMLNGKPLFGSHKTYRGFFVGIILAILTVYAQFLIQPYISDELIIKFVFEDILYVGVLLGFGALFGDLVESFFKRQIGIDDGKSWPVFDQIDWIVGALVLFSFYQTVDLQIWMASLIMFGLLHPIMNLLGYYLGIKKTKF